MKIYLIGMPGSGKSTLGKELAKDLGLPFIDLDSEIVSRTGKPINDIFSQEGETHFRLIESEILHALAFSEKEFVMATGGGAPCFHNGIDIINETGLSVFLDIEVHELVQRMEKEVHRPLLENEDRKKKLEELSAKRMAVYNKAHLHFTSQSMLADIIEKIQSKK